MHLYEIFKNRTINWVLCLIMGSAFFNGGVLLTAQDWNKINIQSHQLGERIYVLGSGAGGNVVAYLGDDGILLVDSDFSQLHQKLVDSLREIGKKSVKILINTHWHFDHTGGNLSFAQKDCDIYAHANVKKRMSTSQTIGILNIDITASPPLALPKYVFKEKMNLEFSYEHILLLHLPNAHTDGDTCVFFRDSNVLHAGDLVFNKQYPFIDVYGGGSINGMIDGLDVIIGLCNDQTIVVPGHGPLLNKVLCIEYKTMLMDFRRAVAQEIKSGKNLHQIQESPVLKSITDKWGYQHFPPAMFIKMVYLSLTKQ